MINVLIMEIIINVYLGLPNSEDGIFWDKNINLCNPSLLPSPITKIRTFSNKDGNAPTAKNNSKYNNCTLECIELSTCTELLLKLEREKTFFGVLRTASM